MKHHYQFHTDADGICIEVCPYRQTQGWNQQLIRVGSFYEKMHCPHCLEQTDKEVICGFPFETR